MTGRNHLQVHFETSTSIHWHTWSRIEREKERERERERKKKREKERKREKKREKKRERGRERARAKGYKRRGWITTSRRFGTPGTYRSISYCRRCSGSPKISCAFAKKKEGHLEVGGACQNNQKHKDPNFREEEKKRKGGR